MRFKFFGFKGELNPIKQNKTKKPKDQENDDKAVVGVGFRSFSEFGESSRFSQKQPPMAEAKKPHQNGAISLQLPPSKPKNWCGTPVPTTSKPIPPEGISIEDEPTVEFEKVTPSTKPKNLKKGLPPSVPKREVEDTIPIENTNNLGANKVIKERKTANKPSVQDVFSNQRTEVEDHQSTLISMTQRSEDFDDSADEIGGPTTANRQPETKKSNLKKPEPTEIVRTGTRVIHSGYSDQAASIFFRSDSPEPEQRIRNFTIRKDDGDDDDNLSQTSA